MRIVLDSNILFSALIKDSFKRKIILEYDGKFLFPSYIFEELQEHKKELLQKAQMNADEFDTILQILLKKVFIIPKEALLPFKQEAIDIVKDIDLDDALFFACALAYPESVIWSDDKKLKEQTKIKVCNTPEIVKILSS